MDMYKQLFTTPCKTYFNGAEIGSTDRDRRVENCRMTPLLVKKVNANDNFAPQDFALAA